MNAPTELDPADIWIDPTPPDQMHEDQLDKRLAELESNVMAALVLGHRNGTLTLPDGFAEPVEAYGRLWDETWTR